MKTETMLPDPAQALQFFTDKMAFTTGPIEVNHQIEDGDEINIIDVREAEDYGKGHVPGAKNLPEPLWSNTSLLRRDCLNVLYCYSSTCHLAAKAAVEFAGKGFPVMEMDGGFEAWEKNDLPVKK
jgi:rhodanese-related sulfurtransferase